MIRLLLELDVELLGLLSGVLLGIDDFVIFQPVSADDALHREFKRVGHPAGAVCVGLVLCICLSSEVIRLAGFAANERVERARLLVDGLGCRLRLGCFDGGALELGLER